MPEPGPPFAPPPAAAPPAAALPVAPLLLDAKSAASLCGVGRTLWLSLAASGRTPAPVRLGRRVLWNRDVLLRWCAAGCPGRSRWEAMAKRGDRT